MQLLGPKLHLLEHFFSYINIFFLYCLSKINNRYLLPIYSAIDKISKQGPQLLYQNENVVDPCPRYNNSGDVLGNCARARPLFSKYYFAILVSRRQFFCFWNKWPNTSTTMHTYLLHLEGKRYHKICS